MAGATFLTCDELAADVLRLVASLVVLCTLRSLEAVEREVEFALALSVERLVADEARTASREVRFTFRSTEEPIRFLSHPSFAILLLGVNLSTRDWLIDLLPA